jgi:hypothetical protein
MNLFFLEVHSERSFHRMEIWWAWRLTPCDWFGHRLKGKKYKFCVWCGYKKHSGNWVFHKYRKMQRKFVEAFMSVPYVAGNGETNLKG